MLEANAVNGVNRQVANRKVNTAAVVNEAITRGQRPGARPGRCPRRAAAARPQRPSAEQVETYAYQVAVLAALQSLTGANTSGQIGRWDFRSAQSVHDAFNSYLNRRVQGQRSRWNRR
jgi:hypothetical protein